MWITKRILLFSNIYPDSSLEISEIDYLLLPSRDMTEIPLKRRKSINQIQYRITGIFCGCLIFAEFCGSIEFAEIKNRKIFHSRYNDEIMSEDTVQLRIFQCLSGIVV